MRPTRINKNFKCYLWNILLAWNYPQTDTDLSVSTKENKLSVMEDLKYKNIE